MKILTKEEITNLITKAFYRGYDVGQEDCLIEVFDTGYNLEQEEYQGKTDSISVEQYVKSILENLGE